MIRPMDKRRRVLGTFLGVTLATVLLPGISTILDSPPWEVVLAGAVFLIVNQLIYSYPSDIRTGHRSSCCSWAWSASPRTP